LRAFYPRLNLPNHCRYLRHRFFEYYWSLLQYWDDCLLLQLFLISQHYWVPLQWWDGYLILPPFPALQELVLQELGLDLPTNYSVPFLGTHLPSLSLLLGYLQEPDW